MIVGRDKEQKILDKLYRSDRAEFLVVYGRRRIGKTFLIREYFKQKSCVLIHATGIHKGKLHKQLEKFIQAVSNALFKKMPLAIPESWDEAFERLTNSIEQGKEKIVIFLDELPWMASRKSGLLEAIDYYWNHHWSTNPNIIFVACGSSASWLIKNIIYNKSGLHNRITRQIKLKPFNLSETKEYLSQNGMKFNDKGILKLYMAIGGIPYYLNYVESGLSVEQTIQMLFFDEDAPLYDEFKKLFTSLFAKADYYIELVQLLSQKTGGISRAQLEKKAKLSHGGGRLTSRLRELSDAGFIQTHLNFDKKNGEYYRLIDEFSLFYLKWCKGQDRKKFIKNHWIHCSKKSEYAIWSGYAFENICMRHIDQIVDKLAINCGGSIGSWSFIPRKQDEQGAQIDLLIDRNDDAITLCEIKYNEKPFIITKQYSEALKRKMDVFRENTATDKQLFMTLISAAGVKQNTYSQTLLSSHLSLSDLLDG